MKLAMYTKKKLARLNRNFGNPYVRETEGLLGKSGVVKFTREVRYAVENISNEFGS